MIVSCFGNKVKFQQQAIPGKLCNHRITNFEHILFIANLDQGKKVKKLRLLQDELKSRLETSFGLIKAFLVDLKYYVFG